jgi:hypothetical protein
MGLDVVSVGQTAAQVTQAIANTTTSSRLYTQMTPLAGDALTASTTAEQPFASSYTIPANSLTVGQSLHVRGAGVYTTSAILPPTQRARLKAGGVTLVDTGAVGVVIALSAARYMFDMTMIVRSIGVNGSVEAFGRLDFATTLTGVQTILAGPSGAVGDSGNPVTIDTTQPLTISLSTTFGNVASGNANSLRQLSIHSLRPPM